MLFKSIVSSHNPEINNSFTIIFIKINNINLNIVKINIKNTYFISRKLPEPLSKKNMSSAVNKTL